MTYVGYPRNFAAVTRVPTMLHYSGWNENQTDVNEPDMDAMQYQTHASKGDRTYRNIIQETLGSSRGESKEKQSHNELVVDWLEENYEYKQDSCLPRSTLYTHYLEFCNKSSLISVGAATFGKIIRQKFPLLTTRRLGTRGQSKYHYLGLCIKASSVYHVKKHPGRGLTRFTTNTSTDRGEFGQKQSNPRVRTILEGFPKIWKRSGKDSSNDVNNLIKVELFLVMYKAHCQRILDTVVGANFEEVETFLLHFWHRMPDHVSKILDIDAISEVVTACDTIFFKKLIDVIIPNSIRVIPESFHSEVINFTKNFLPWLDICLINAPKNLAAAKMDVAKTYIKLVQRHLSFLELSKAAGEILASDDQKLEMTEDIEETDIEDVFGIIRNGVDDHYRKESKQNHNFCVFRDILVLLTKQASVEAFIAVLDKMLYNFLIKPAESSKIDFRQHSAEFILQWSQFVALMMKDLTLRSAESFSSIHLLTVMAMEYIFLVIENKMAMEQEMSIWQKIKPYAFVDKENRESLLDKNSGKSKRERKRQKKSHQGIIQSKKPKIQQELTSNNLTPVPIHLPVGFSEELNFDFNQPIVDNSWDNYLDTQLVTYANQLTSYDVTNCYSSTNSFRNRPDCAYENAGYWMKNMPTLQDLCINYNWGNSKEEDMTQFYPYLKDINFNYEQAYTLLQS